MELHLYSEGRAWRTGQHGCKLEHLQVMSFQNLVIKVINIAAAAAADYDFDLIVLDIVIALLAELSS
jgi:hypothetical protein